MRGLVVLLLVAAVGGVAYLWLDDDGHGARKTGRDDGGATDRGGVPTERPGIVAPLPQPEPDALPAFVAECRKRGDEAVPLLLRRIRLDPDRKLQPRWKFKDGVPVGYPTLRSAYIAALAAIPGDSAGDALEQILKDAKSVEESYQIATALAARERIGWTEPLLQRAGAGDASDQALRMEMAEFAARADPAGTATHVLEAAPRGDSTDDARILAAAVAALPYEESVGTTGRVLDDATITPRAKAAIVRNVLRRRPEPSVFTDMEERIVRGHLDDKLKIDAAYAAANSIWFVNDTTEYETAVAQGETGKADEIRRRFNERVSAARRLIRTAVGTDDDPRAKSMIRILEAYEQKMPQ